MKKLSKLFVGIICLTTLASCNQNNNKKEEDSKDDAVEKDKYLDYKDYELNSLKELYSQSEEIYLVYFYEKDNNKCKENENKIFSYLDDYSNNKEHLKLYLYDFSKIKEETCSFLQNNYDYQKSKKYMIEDNFTNTVERTIINTTPSLYVIKYNYLMDYYEDHDILDFLFNNNYDSRDYSIIKDYEFDSLDNFYNLGDEKYLIYLYWDGCPHCFNIRGKIYDYLLNDHDTKMYVFNIKGKGTDEGEENRSKFKIFEGDEKKLKEEIELEIKGEVSVLGDTIYYGVPALYAIDGKKLVDYKCGDDVVKCLDTFK